MTVQTTPEAYPIPETEYEMSPRGIAARELKRGMQFEGQAIATVKIGRKWVTATTETGKTLEILLDEQIAVLESKPTRSSVQDVVRADKNRRIAKRLQNREVPLQEALSKFNESLTGENTHLSSWDLDRVLAEQAAKTCWDTVAHVAGLDQVEGDLVDVYETVCETFKEQILNGSERALSRSTSVTSNLLEDVERSAKAQFIRNPWF